MTDRELALNYCRARAAGMTYQQLKHSIAIEQRAGVSPALGPRERRERIQAFVSRSLGFDPDRVRTVGVIFREPPAGFVRPENPFHFEALELHAGDVGAMIVEGDPPIEPPPGWVVVLIHDGEGWLCSTVPPDHVKVLD